MAAAGNSSSGQVLGYPAALTGVTVALGLDWEGKRADYNVDVSRAQVEVMEAVGGTPATRALGPRSMSAAWIPVASALALPYTNPA